MSEKKEISIRKKQLRINDCWNFKLLSLVSLL